MSPGIENRQHINLTCFCNTTAALARHTTAAEALNIDSKFHLFQYFQHGEKTNPFFSLGSSAELAQWCPQWGQMVYET